MVLLSITAAMVDGLTSLRHYDVDKSELRQDDLPRLEEATIGNPIAHAQVITLSKLLKEACTSHEIGQVSFHLDDLLRGSVIYNDPPKPREEPVSLQVPGETYLGSANRGSDGRIQSFDGSPAARRRGSSIRTND